MTATTATPPPTSARATNPPPVSPGVGSPGNRGPAAGSYRGRPGFATLLRELRDDAILLAKQEFALARTETAQNAATIGTNIGKAVAFGALALVGVLLILVGLSIALGFLLTQAALMSPIAAIAAGFLIFGAVFTLVFAILLYLATKKIRETHALPQRSMDSLNSDANLAARAASGR